MPLEMDDDLMNNAGRSRGGINFSNSDDDDVDDDADENDNIDDKATRTYDSDIDDIMEEEDASGDDYREGGGRGDVVVIVLVLGACWGTEELGWTEQSGQKLRDVR